ncbi:MAG: alpha-E domain-containing protein, partial [Candidatus Nanopelagicales bacterium]|nr:alpha-E domain-containing protein [Candidatus Nanopelagicales bacterium]
LSRLAESFFWIGRYVERAEATTRLLAEHHQLLVEDKRVPVRRGARVLLAALALPGGSDRPAGALDAGEPVETPERLFRAVLGSNDNPGTIAGATTAARENARAIQDALSGDVYEALNAAHRRLQAATAGAHDPVSPGVLLHGILERLAVVAGVMDWTSPRDEAYIFLRLGRALERIDMTARLLAVRHDLLWPQSGPATALRAVGGLHAFLRGRHPLAGDEVRAFLVLDRAFPRSMLGCAMVAEQATRELQALGSVVPGGGILRSVGLLRGELEFVPPDPDPALVDRLADYGLEAAIEAGAEISSAFFRQVDTVVWSQ